jgi:glycosyltransferase involved in cell wall biosynthesis
MKIISITAARNESDIIELFVRYHLRFIDQMIIIDHLSIDNTLQILKSLKDEGAPIEIVCETDPGFSQSKLTTQLMRRAIEKYGGDWVLPLDADEFLMVEGNLPIRPMLEKLSPENAYRLSWRTYVPRTKDLQDQIFLFDKIRYRRKQEPKTVGKVLVPKSIGSRIDVFLSLGNHAIVDEAGNTHRDIYRCDHEHLYLAHFPVRSPEQLSAKILLGWMSRLASLEQKGDHGWHVRKLFDRLRTGENLSYEEVEEIGRYYAVKKVKTESFKELVYDPIQLNENDIRLRYTDRYNVNLVGALCDLAEKLAKELAAERKKVMDLEKTLPDYIGRIRSWIRSKTSTARKKENHRRD